MNLDKQKIIDMVLEKLKGVPGDVLGSTKSAIEISPPGDLFRRGNIAAQGERNGGVTYDQQVQYAIDNLKKGANAMKLVGYTAPLRALTRSPLELASGESARRLSTGRGWEIFDRVLNK